MIIPLSWRVPYVTKIVYYRMYWLFIFDVLLVTGLCLYFAHTIFYFYPNVYQTQYYYESLTNDQINEIRIMMSDIKPLYSQYASAILFTGDIEKTCSHIKCGADYQDTLGMNYGKGRIVVLYRSDIDDMKITVCHELLHAVIYPPQEQGLDGGLHEIVYDLALRDPCFYNKKIGRDNAQALPMNIKNKSYD